MRGEEEEVRTVLGLEMRVWIVDTVSMYLALCGETNMFVSSSTYKTL